MIPDIRIEDFSYDLPEERIAKYPLPERDSSKLLIYKDGDCSEKVFRNLPEVLSSQLSLLQGDSEPAPRAMMVFNDTKVVPARLFFKRATGAHIEIFCLKPIDPAEYNTVFATTEECTWRCVVGNIKRWKGDILTFDHDPEGTGHASGCQVSREADDSTNLLESINLTAELVRKEDETSFVKFRWQGGVPFSKVLELCGRVPIPPYLKRETEDIDLERYQTLYAKYRGSVAAPTAGLHFTEEVLEEIKANNIEIENVCLHVGAGTFLPVKTSSISGHTMHREPFVVTLDFLRKLLDKPTKLIAVGTTSVRTLESLYYVGVSCIEKGGPEDVTQWCPYEREYPYSLQEAIKAIIDYLEAHNEKELKVSTRIIIVPGFKFRVVDMMVTNFHQPQSTLLLLISAFVGGDWHTIYNFALANGFRFLSYGDSSLLFRR